MGADQTPQDPLLPLPEALTAKEPEVAPARPATRPHRLRAGSEFGLQGAPNNPLASIQHLRRKFRPRAS